MTHLHVLSIAATHIAASLLLASLAPSARPQTPDNTSVLESEVRSLKAAYLHCERVAAERVLDIGEAASCSAIYEKLLKLGFNGEFERLLAWWQAARVTHPR